MQHREGQGRQVSISRCLKGVLADNLQIPDRKQIKGPVSILACILSDFKNIVLLLPILCEGSLRNMRPREGIDLIALLYATELAHHF